jgi:hypothetical protein
MNMEGAIVTEGLGNVKRTLMKIRRDRVFMRGVKAYTIVTIIIAIVVTPVIIAATLLNQSGLSNRASVIFEDDPVGDILGVFFISSFFIGLLQGKVPTRFRYGHFTMSFLTGVLGFLILFLVIMTARGMGIEWANSGDWTINEYYLTNGSMTWSRVIYVLLFSIQEGFFATMSSRKQLR